MTALPTRLAYLARQDLKAQSRFPAFQNGQRSAVGSPSKTYRPHGSRWRVPDAAFIPALSRFLGSASKERIEQKGHSDGWLSRPSNPQLNRNNAPGEWSLA